MIDVEALQDSHCIEKDREHRKAAGQFFTPRWIASGMARWVTATRPKQIIDPAFGFGILLDECARQGYQGQLVGHEIDPAVVARWRHAAGGKPAIRLHEGDFLESAGDCIAAAVVNPPYNRFQRRELPAKLQLQLARSLGELASGYTNQYALFLYVVLSRLAKGGRAAFIVPSEFLATGYGVQVKKFLIQNGRLRHLVLFDPSTRIFADAMTTACVLLFDGGACDTLDVWHFEGEADALAFQAVCAADSAAAPSLRVAYRDLDPTQNWQGLGRGQSDRSGFAPLREFGDVKRGIATGANEFFVLRPSEAETLGLRHPNLVPCIASASAVPDIFFGVEQMKSLESDDRPVFLFDGHAGTTDSSSRYVEYGEAQAFHLRYLTRMRRPWYKLETRRAAPLLLAVFGRDGFRVSLNASSAVNLTAFHGFYPKHGFDELVGPIWLYFQTGIARASYSAQQRAYGDGLKKLEPGDWGKLHIPDWRRWDSTSLRQAQHLAQEALLGLSSGQRGPLSSAIDELEVLVARNRNGQLATAVDADRGGQLTLI
jgi:adenine-specific DNA-methyltransferase